MLSQSEKDVLITNFSTLVSEFPYNSLIDKIFSAKIIDSYEKSQIESNSTIIEKNRAFFQNIQTKPPGTFTLVCTLYSQVESVQSHQAKQLLQQIENLQAGANNVAGQQVQNSGRNIVDGSKPAKPYINKIYKDVSTEWVSLAYALNIEEKEVKKIKMEERDSIDDQCHTMLYKFSRKHASNFTKSMLIDALLECDLREAADKIAPLSLN